MRLTYFFIWTPILAILAGITYSIAVFDELHWIIVLVWLWPILFGWRVSVRAREAHEVERLLRDQVDTEAKRAAGLEAANLQEPPSVRRCTDSQ